jgi:hypothetical protein
MKWFIGNEAEKTTITFPDVSSFAVNKPWWNNYLSSRSCGRVLSFKRMRRWGVTNPFTWSDTAQFTGIARVIKNRVRIVIFIYMKQKKTRSRFPKYPHLPQMLVQILMIIKILAVIPRWIMTVAMKHNNLWILKNVGCVGEEWLIPSLGRTQPNLQVLPE